ncbi:MAG: hypothetical protein LBC83_07750 [Oscillospiraceae bacterium]|jgi:hypothetical protein|nr:hypothetical protein [Oscillospiraceae bacterium]
MNEAYTVGGERIAALAKAAKGYQRATRLAQVLSWGHTAALGAAAASLVIGGARLLRTTKKQTAGMNGGK